MTRQRADFLLQNCGELVTPLGNEARRGAELRQLRRLENAWVAALAGDIVAIGTADSWRGSLQLDEAQVVDADGASVIPGFVDPHTHAVFGRSRPEEYAARIEGKSYIEIARGGGGIHSSVRDLRGRSAEELLRLAVPRLRTMLEHGTTTVEIKTGYGLSLADELKSLEVIRQLRGEVFQELVATFLGAHEIPQEFRDKRQRYVDLVLHEMLPAVSGLAEFNDVFCEPSVFTPEESRRILEQGKELGLQAKIHADELESSGGAELACELGAVSADHLIRVSEAGIQALGASATVAVLLPATSFGLALRDYAPARKLIDAGAAVALATDFNPGSSHCPSMQAAWSLACSVMRWTPDEALTGCTLNAAVAVGRGAKVGSIETGKRADLVILQGRDYREVPFRFGVNNAKLVIQAGRVVRS